MSSSTLSTIRLKTAEQYTLVLKGRLTAGYQWAFSADTEDVISVSKKIKAQKGNDSIRPGGSADEVFIITALQKGKTIVHFRQLRVWEADSKPLEEKIITVICE